MKIKSGIIVRPKFYALLGKTEEIVKIKGLGKRLNYLEFLGLIHSSVEAITQNVHYSKFTKFKEALRRELIPNQEIKVFKHFSLNDQKRVWKNEFSLKFESSIPLILNTDSIENKSNSK